MRMRHAVIVAFAVLSLSASAGAEPAVERAPVVEGASLPEAGREPEAPAVSRIPTPDPLKAVYMTSWVASTPSLRARVIEFIEQTEVNGVIIDVKDDTGRVSFPSTNEALVAVGSPESRITNLPEIIADLHARGVYVIARIAVFQDPYLAKKRPDLAVLRASDGGVWEDRKGLSWVDPGAKEVWDYIVALAKEVHAVGFDELNFDYIRFPSDGNMKNLSYQHSDLENQPRAEILESFFAYLCEALEELDVPLSADIFGMTTTATDDMRIGQILENTLPYFDYVCPMVYPSHYPPKFAGHSNPNAVPYEIIKYAMDSAVKRADAMNCSRGKLRPWLQDFDYPVTYTAADVRAQIKAVYDAGLTSWFMWDPSNKYTLAAYEKE